MAQFQIFNGLSSIVVVIDGRAVSVDKSCAMEVYGDEIHLYNGGISPLLQINYKEVITPAVNNAEELRNVLQEYKDSTVNDVINAINNIKINAGSVNLNVDDLEALIGGTNERLEDQIAQLNNIDLQTEAIGTKDDAAWTGTGSATLVSALKAIWNKLAGVLNIRALSSSTDSVAVTGSVTANGLQPCLVRA